MVPFLLLPELTNFNTFLSETKYKHFINKFLVQDKDSGIVDYYDFVMSKSHRVFIENDDLYNDKLKPFITVNRIIDNKEYQYTKDYLVPVLNELSKNELVRIKSKCFDIYDLNQTNEYLRRESNKLEFVISKLQECTFYEKNITVATFNCKKRIEEHLKKLNYDILSLMKENLDLSKYIINFDVKKKDLVYLFMGLYDLGVIKEPANYSGKNYLNTLMNFLDNQTTFNKGRMTDSRKTKNDLRSIHKKINSSDLCKHIVNITEDKDSK